MKPLLKDIVAAYYEAAYDIVVASYVAAYNKALPPPLGSVSSYCLSPSAVCSNLIVVLVLVLHFPLIDRLRIESPWIVYLQMTFRGKLQREMVATTMGPIPQWLH